MPKWYEIKAQVRAAGEPTAAEVFVYGNIGDRWNEDGVVASDMVRDVSALDVDTINLRINSYGGSVSDGLAIYNALKRHRATVHVHVDGVAISCASYIAMAGDKITMAKNAQMMIHAPWGISMGNAAQLREEADVLDRFAKALASGYADKSGQSHDEIMVLLSDGKDHWFLADEAVEAGFADEVGEEVAVAASLANSFNLSRFKPAAAAAIPKEAVMPDPVKPAAQPATRNLDDNKRVVAMFKPFAEQPAVLALQTEVLSDPELTVEQIQARLLDTIGKGAEPAAPKGAFPKVETTEDESDKRMDAMAAAIMYRAGVDKSEAAKAAIKSNPFRAKKLLDLAQASLDRCGFKSTGMANPQIVAAAFTQGTSDFPVLLENVMHKTLQSAYARAAFTWNRFCATGSVGDFRAHNRYRRGSFGVLDAVNELGEFTNKTIPDGEKATISATTKGNIINLSRKAIIDDDLGAFVGLSNDLGRAAALTVESDVYALLALNGGLGPVMPDGQTLFHASHNNISTAAAISMLSLDADRVLMASQLDVSGADYLDLRPDVLLVPVGLGGLARTINDAIYDPDTANKLQKPNMVNGLFSDIVDSRRIAGTRRYVFANSSEAPVLEVAFLDGNSEPYLEMQDGFDVDGARWKVRLDYGVAAVDYRGAVTNAGA